MRNEFQKILENNDIKIYPEIYKELQTKKIQLDNVISSSGGADYIKEACKYFDKYEISGGKDNILRRIFKGLG